MKKGGYRKAAQGFTIVEVMIVLAVSSLMFITAVVIINGRQSKTQFTTAINGLQQQIQQIINETTSGYYPNQGTFTCIGTTSPVTFNGSASPQGSNGGCIFMGKAVQFGIGAGAIGLSSIGIFPLVGNQYQAGTLNPVLNITQANPRAVSPGSGEATVPQTAIKQILDGALTVAPSSSFCVVGGVSLGSGMCYVDAGSGTPVVTGVVAFVSGDSQGNITAIDANGNLQPGSQQMSLYGVTGSTVNSAGLSTTSDKIGNTTLKPGSKLAAASSVSICMDSGTTNQSGLFTIDSGLHVSLRVMGGLTC
ncbi:MAG TPA: prepilin-type N-terminal cleavage/methylation domain-containing protein [Candidatus Saccharimonadales bacterium]|nr:prepilin-type N-terminal cleavage/methylation domain-containing protein [Candidatus Saccharimonadales bacterium]